MERSKRIRMILSKKTRLELNNKQLTKCNGHAGVSRHAWNWGVEVCQKSLENKEKCPSAIDLHKKLVAEVKKENSWYYNYSKCSPQQSLRNLETAWKRCFKKIAKQPKFKKKGCNDSFYLEGNIQILGDRIKLPKFGWVKMSESLDELSVKNVVISRVSSDWFVAFKYEKETSNLKKPNNVVGVDLGVKTLATFSNGEVFENIKAYKNAKKNLRKNQKSVSRKFKKGIKNQSSNYKKSVLRLSKAHKKVADCRNDVLHKTTTYLAKTFDTVVIEDLKVSNMVKNHKLASAILDGGFYKFKEQLIYKKQLYGGHVIIANTFFPSSKLCSVCGDKNKELKLKDRFWTCKNGHKLDRDFNASKNLENLAVSSTVSAFGDESSVGNKPIQFIDKLGIKHQMLTFV